MNKHELKLDTKFFSDVKSGKKNFEIRNNDRGFEIGDILELKKYKSYKNGKKPHYVRTDGESKFKTYNPNRADTIKVKVIDILTADVINDGLSIAIAEGSLSLSEFGTNLPLISAIRIFKTLQEYLNTSRLPDDYVVMAIEVVE